MAREYIAFISYRHAPRDSAVAQTAHSLIEQYRIPRSLRRDGKKRFGYVFRDQEELPVSSDLSDDICRALDHSQNLIVICSPETAKSPWVAREIGYFLEHHDHSRVFAVLAGGEPAEVFPAALTHVTRPDGTVVEVEPLAMDARADTVGAMKRKLRSQIRRLYAALLGCPYDKLILRQQRRAWRRATAVAAVVLAAVVGFSGMLLAKNRQIEKKNEDLAAQKLELQLRESELLTRDAEESLDEGLRAAAAESAVAALPTATGERPYYPQAEAVLIQALGICEDPWSGYWVTETELPMSAAVEATVINADGTRLMAADQYGAVSCFDMATGETLWSLQLDTNAIFHMIGCGDKVLCHHAGGVTALSWQDGAAIWNYQNGFISELPGVVSADSTQLAVMDWRMTADFARYKFHLQVLDAQTGAEVSRILVTEGMALAASEELPYVEFSGQLGAFAPDGKTFAGVCRWEDVIGQEFYTDYVADLTAGTVRLVYTRAAGEDYAPVQIWFDGHTCLAAYVQAWSKVALCVEKVDVDSGLCLWQTRTPEESDWIENDVPVSFLRGGDVLFASCDRYIYALDLKDGSVDAQQSMDAPILSVRNVDEYFLEILAADGTYVLGWRNQNGMYLSNGSFATAVDFGDGQEAQVCGKAMLQMNMEDGKLLGATVREGGAVALVPEAGASRVVIRRVQQLEDLSQRQMLDLLPEGAELASGSALLLNDGIALGVVAVDDENNAVLVYNGEKTYLLPTQLWDMEHMAVLPDGSGYLSCGSWGEYLAFYDVNGTQTLLTEQHNDVLYESGGNNYVDGRWAFDLHYGTGGHVLAAACDGQVLRLWHDGVLQQEVALPEELTFSLPTNTEYRRMLAVSSEYVYLSHFADDRDFSVDAVAVYTIATGDWDYISCDHLPMTEAILTPDSTGKRIALLDDAANLHIYEASGDQVCSVPFPVPRNAVVQLDFLPGDGYLVAKSQDQLLMILDAATGELLFRQRIEGSALSRVRGYMDEKNNRLYLADGNKETDVGLCLDMRSWAVLARIPGLLCYDARQDLIYRVTQDGTLLSCRLPTTGEMTQYWYDVLLPGKTSPLQ